VFAVCSRPDAAAGKKKLRIDTHLISVKGILASPDLLRGWEASPSHGCQAHWGRHWQFTTRDCAAGAQSQCLTFPSSSDRAHSSDAFKDEFVQAAYDIALHRKCIQVPIPAVFHAIPSISRVGAAAPTKPTVRLHLHTLRKDRRLSAGWPTFHRTIQRRDQRWTCQWTGLHFRTSYP
jgi:hypothetical protein